MSDFVCPEGARLIPISGKNGFGLSAIVDAEDYDRLSRITWHLGGGGYARGYIAKLPNGRTLSAQMHRMVMGLPNLRDDVTHTLVDHINRDPLDNRRQNLRLATTHENARNSAGQKNRTCIYKGVRPTKPNAAGVITSYGASIRVDDRMLNLGTFPNQEAAARAYDSAAHHFYRDFACLNFPDEHPAPYARVETRKDKYQAIDLAIACLSRRGINSPSLSEIAAHAGVSANAVRTHFKTSDEWAGLATGAKRAMDQGRERINAPRREANRAQIVQAHQTLMATLNRPPTISEVMELSGVSRNPVRKHLEGLSLAFTERKRRPRRGER